MGDFPKPTTYHLPPTLSYIKTTTYYTTNNNCFLKLVIFPNINSCYHVPCMMYDAPPLMMMMTRIPCFFPHIFSSWFCSNLLVFCSSLLARTPPQYYGGRSKVNGRNNYYPNIYFPLVVQFVFSSCSSRALCLLFYLLAFTARVITILYLPYKHIHT